MAKGFSHLPTHHLPVSDAEGGASNSWGRWQPYSKTSSALTLSPEGQASLLLILELSVTALTCRRGWKWLSGAPKAGRKGLAYQNTISGGSDPPGQKSDDARATRLGGSSSHVKRPRVGTLVESPSGQLSCHLSPGTWHVREEPLPLFKTLSDVLVSPGETSDTMQAEISQPGVL